MSRTATTKVAAKKAAPAKGAGKGKPAVRAPRTLEEFMVLAWAMETESGERYEEFADAMEMHNNREVAELFRKMAVIEGRHATQIMAEMGWIAEPSVPPGRPGWDGFEAPETTPADEVHYLMQPYHALQLALQNEERAERFFGKLARIATVPSVKAAAEELEAEEHDHVLLVQAWIRKVPKPDLDWADDPDPPSYTD
jgi:rubrerythrin